MQKLYLCIINFKILTSPINSCKNAKTPNKMIQQITYEVKVNKTPQWIIDWNERKAKRKEELQKQFECFDNK